MISLNFKIPEEFVYHIFQDGFWVVFIIIIIIIIIIIFSLRFFPIS